MANEANEAQAEKITKQLKLVIFLFVVAPIVLLVIFIEFRFRSFESAIPYQEPNIRDDARMEIDVMPWHPVDGQRLYVPAYSHVYHQQGEPVHLTVTLNIRNTDMNHDIVVSSVRYFDTAGKELRSMLKKPLRLGPLAATEFMIKREDKAGGSGASFIVEWQAGTEVNQPLAETIMIDTRGQQGISFTASAVILSEGTGENISPSTPVAPSP
ncbi:hypothetical protein FF011L_27620 [Roseimaritima multifibrata]|uniref:DUF3124 domain-containing protein n=1 Tax=Roseimaritima multifibrata TaxID=1930274 RepID=A0A517MGH9_9BACT|nr:DUF3124 domain-containing protein [Roseimaritima multifibrata]QDS93985.1 hypothetical protein FF011L_27620 [Roseimaritima multifibrata]